MDFIMQFIIGVIYVKMKLIAQFTHVVGIHHTSCQYGYQKTHCNFRQAIP